MLSKPRPFQHGPKMHLNMCWLNSSHSKEDTNPSNVSEVTKCISTCVYQNLLFKWGNKLHLNMCSTNPEDTICMSTFIGQNYSAKTQNVSNHVLTNPLSMVTKWICTCVDQTHPIPERTQYGFQHVLTNIPYPSENTKCNSTCDDRTPPVQARTHKCYAKSVDQTPPMPERTQNIFINKDGVCTSVHNYH